MVQRLKAQLQLEKRGLLDGEQSWQEIDESLKQIKLAYTKTNSLSVIAGRKELTDEQDEYPVNVREVFDRMKKKLRPNSELSDRGVAKHLKISHHRVSYCQKTHTVPWPELYKFSRDEGLTMEYLLTGEESVVKQEAPEKTEGIPIYANKLSAGAGQWIDSENIVSKLGLDPDYVRRYVGPPESLIGSYAQGDSMEPTMRSNDLILVDTSKNHLVSDGVYAIAINNVSVVKRLIMNFKEQQVIVRSDNPNYDDMVFEGEEWDQANVNIIGQAVWVGKQL